MSYKVLYRKYRPNFFKEVVGQESTVKILKNSIINDKISHAYLFAGPRGTGKTSMARIFAKTINCLEPVDGEACGKCLNCQNFSNNPDIIEIDAASNNGVDEIRELINNVKLMPTSSKYKVYIIDEVHMLSQSAFNALLLTLEEPPSHVIFILATTNIENVPITIVSRCQKYEFFRISDDLITKQLQNICEQEKIDYDIEGLKEITELSDGGLRDALSMLDQLSKEKSKINLDLVVKELGSVSLIKIQKLIDYLDANDLNNTINIIDELKKTNLNYKVVTKKLIELLSKKAIVVLEQGNEGLLNYQKIKKIILDLNDFLNKINLNVNPYIILEMILLEIFAGSNQEPTMPEVKVETITKTIKEEKVEEPKQLPKKEENEPKKIKPTEEIKNKTHIRINNCLTEANKQNLNELKAIWSDFKVKISNQYKGLIEDTEPVAASASYAIITTSIKHQDNELNLEINNLEDELKKKMQKELKLVALETSEWAKTKEEYITNIKKGYKYTLMEEKPVIDEDNNKLEELANNIFDSSKIEIN